MHIWKQMNFMNHQSSPTISKNHFSVYFSDFALLSDDTYTYWVVLNAIACLGSQAPDLGRASSILPLCWDGVTTLDDPEKHC